MTNEPVQFVASIEKLLRQIGEENDVADAEIENTLGWKKGDGYLGFITMSRIAGKNKKGEESVLNLVVKTSSKSDALRTTTPIANVFRQEIYFYETVAPRFCEFLQKKGVPAVLKIPRCFKTCSMDKREFLILENMKEVDYKMWDRKMAMEEDHVTMVLREYGRLHAISYAMKDQQPEIFKGLTDDLGDPHQEWMMSPDLEQFYAKMLARAEKSLDVVLHKEELKQFEVFKGEITDFLKRLPELVDEHSVIIHGDGWTNNMLFQYNDAKKPSKPTNMCLIDFQITRLTSPVIELSYFIYSCGSKDVITNLKRYLDVYYESLRENLEKLGSDVEKLYPYATFQNHWRKYARFGVVTATMVIYAELSGTEEAVDLGSAAESGQKISDVLDYKIADLDLYLDRVRHIFLHACNNKFI